MSFEIRLAYDDEENIRQLFAEYTEFLLDLDGDFREILQGQNYGGELEHLAEKYGPPSGRLYIAYFEKQAAGCIALRRISDTECEMKRLYVRPQFRGNRLGEALVAKIIDDAKEIGYHSMLLDTLPSLKRAIQLYESIGFYRISAYNNNHVEHTVFMKLDLLKN